MPPPFFWGGGKQGHCCADIVCSTVCAPCVMCQLLAETEERGNIHNDWTKHSARSRFEQPWKFGLFNSCLDDCPTCESLFVLLFFPPCSISPVVIFALDPAPGMTYEVLTGLCVFMRHACVVCFRNYREFVRHMHGVSAGLRFWLAKPLKRGKLVRRYLNRGAIRSCRSRDAISAP